MAKGIGMAAFGVQDVNKPADDTQWFDTLPDAMRAITDSPGYKYDKSIVVYAFAERICRIIYNPYGWWPVGFVNAEGVNLITKHGLHDTIYGTD